MTPKSAAAIPPSPPRENAYEPSRFEPTGLDGDTAFETLAAMVRAKRNPGPIPDYLRPLIDTGMTELRSALPELGDRDIARTLMVATSLLNQLIGRGPQWTRIILMNSMLNIAEQMWDADTPGAAELLEAIAAAGDATAESPDV